MIAVKYSFSQEDYVLFQKNKNICLRQLGTKEESTLFINIGDLKGYMINEDTITVFTYNSFHKGKLKSWKCPYKVPFIKSEKYLDTCIRMDNFTITFDESVGFVCYKDGIVLWNRTVKCKSFMGIPYYDHLYLDMEYLISEKKILCTISPSFFSGKKKIIEINIEDGRETIIAEKAISPSYSLSGKYILYKKQKKLRSYNSYYVIYDREKNEIINKTSYWEISQNAFWLK